VDDGIYALLDKIKKGEHELNFHAENPSQNFLSVSDLVKTTAIVKIQRINRLQLGARGVTLSLVS
jgi:hypothetical protein